MSSTTGRTQNAMKDRADAIKTLAKNLVVVKGITSSVQPVKKIPATTKTRSTDTESMSAWSSASTLQSEETLNNVQKTLSFTGLKEKVKSISQKRKVLKDVFKSSKAAKSESTQTKNIKSALKMTTVARETRAQSTQTSDANKTKLQGAHPATKKKVVFQDEHEEKLKQASQSKKSTILDKFLTFFKLTSSPACLPFAPKKTLRELYESGEIEISGPILVTKFWRTDL